MTKVIPSKLMKLFQKNRVVVALARGCGLLQRSALSGLVLASLFASVNVYGQGQYYPVSPSGQPVAGYGSTYTGVTVHSNQNLIYLQGAVQTLYGTNVTLEVPIPTGKSAPTTLQYSTAVKAVIEGSYIPGTFVPGVTAATLAAEAVGWRPSDYAATSTAIAQQIITHDSANAVSNLAPVVNELAQSQPTLIDAIMPSILSQVGGNATAATGGNGIQDLVRQAVAFIPNDLSRVLSIISSGTAAINGSVLTASQKTTAFIDPTVGLVQSLINSPFAVNNVPMIDTISRALTNPGTSAMASLSQVLNAEVMALLPAHLTNANAGAIAAGALRAQGGSSAAIASQLATSSPGTANYTNALVNGYQNSASKPAYITALGAPANAGLADAVAAGAAVKGAIVPGDIVALALTNGTPATPPRNIVSAIIGAAQGSALAVINGAINGTTGYGTATLADLAYAGAAAAPIQNAGAITQTLVAHAGLIANDLPSQTKLRDIVDKAIQGAIAGSKTGAFADIVYKAQAQARSTAGMSDPLVRQAIDSMGTANSYIAVVAALAGDGGSNRVVIQNAAYNAPGNEITATGGDLPAAMSGGALVQSLQTNSGQYFASTSTAYYNAANATNTVLADLYAASLVNNTSEGDAALAAAIKQSTVSDVTLTDAANNASRVFSGNGLPSAALAMVRTVVTHIKAEALAGSIEDLFDFVGHQIVLNNTLVKDIAIAATVVDPDNAHFIAHSVAFNASTRTNPTAATGSVASIFEYAQIVNPTPFAVPSSTNPTGAPLGAKPGSAVDTSFPLTPFPGPTKGTIIDRPAAAAAITAGLVTGLMEANLDGNNVTDGPPLNQASTTAGFPNTTAALTSVVSAAVAASISQGGVYLSGPTAGGGRVFNNPADANAGFQQIITSGSGTVVTTQATAGGAGAITGYIAQVTISGDTTISAITAAVLRAAVGGSARNFAMQIAQAAGQALRWVGGASVTSVIVGSAGNPSFDIATAMAPTVTGFATLAQLEAAVSFGISQAASGVIGAGALGLNATGLNPGTGTLIIKATLNNNADFYQVRSATGTPVTDIFNL